jgi:hypothetical protein
MMTSVTRVFSLHKPDSSCAIGGLILLMISNGTLGHVMNVKSGRTLGYTYRLPYRCLAAFFAKPT